ncbi:MAG: MBL fold metallo-hydrolase [Acidimicrobiia bacterium]|nr:MAG: MBL fold metallo-hydrolase [Acidimicrobiia bacterium]
MNLDLSSDATNAYAKQISTESLGDHSYIVVVGDEAVAIDIQRDLDRFEDVLSDVDASLVAVFETHIHNDYVSGGKRLADIHGAEYVLPANTGAPYDHTPLADGATIDIGGWTMQAMHTPGHTHNHTSYVLVAPSGPVAIFSGGSMLVGAVGRSDLLGPDHTEMLLKDQYASVHRIADELPDPSLVAPTHGSGSFCSASAIADSTSTVDREKLQNPALVAPSVEAFSMSQMMGYAPYPAYYRHMAPSNLEPMGAPPTGDLARITTPDELRDATIVDVRPFSEYAAGHIPGSLSFEMSNDDAVYMGWTLDWGSPLAIVGTGADAQEVRMHLHRIGWDNVVGRIDPADLRSFSAGQLSETEIVTFADLGVEIGQGSLDVRDSVEQSTGVLPGADLAHLSVVAADPERFASHEPLLIYCGSGYRSGIAAGFIERAGGVPVVVKDSPGNYKGSLSVPAV